MKIKWSVTSSLFPQPMQDQIMEIDGNEFQKMSAEEKIQYIRDQILEELAETVAYNWEVIDRH